ncbi:MAG: hypothetical protein J5659_05295 [Clostridia bacterium]|nr:hypothetical protein [Clostridia bacterium]
MELAIITIIATRDLVSLETSYIVIVNGQPAEHFCSAAEKTYLPKVYYDFMIEANHETIKAANGIDDWIEIDLYYGTQLREIR